MKKEGYLGIHEKDGVTNRFVSKDVAGIVRLRNWKVGHDAEIELYPVGKPTKKDLRELREAPRTRRRHKHQK